MAEVKFTEGSVIDLENIGEYISRSSISRAKTQIEKLIMRVENLKPFPAIGRVVPEFGDSSIRELIEGNYRIVYQITDEVVYILTFRHVRQGINGTEIEKLKV